MRKAKIVTIILLILILFIGALIPYIESKKSNHFSYRVFTAYDHEDGEELNEYDFRNSEFEFSRTQSLTDNWITQMFVVRRIQFLKVPEKSLGSPGFRSGTWRFQEYSWFNIPIGEEKTLNIVHSV